SFNHPRRRARGPVRFGVAKAKGFFDYAKLKIYIFFAMAGRPGKTPEPRTGTGQNPRATADRRITSGKCPSLNERTRIPSFAGCKDRNIPAHNKQNNLLFQHKNTKHWKTRRLFFLVLTSTSKEGG